MADRIQHEWVGKSVHCAAVGKIDEFCGIVEEAWLGIFDKKPFIYFHVRNYANGTRWHRDLTEVRLADALDVEEAA